MSPRDAFDLLKTTYTDWSEDKASRLAAALAYYTAFSVAPLLLIAIAVAGLVFGEEAASGAVYAQLEGLLGAEAAGAVQTGIQNAHQPGSARYRRPSAWACCCGALRTSSPSCRTR